MAIYITQGRYTEHALKGMLEHPEDRAPAIAALLEAAGGKLLNYYVTFGEHDFLIVSEFEGEAKESLSSLLVAGATGGVTGLKTTQAITTAQAKESMEKAQKIIAGFHAAGES